MKKAVTENVELKGIEALDLHFKKHPYKSGTKSIEEIRELEDRQLLLYMKAIFKILKTKCNRCKTKSCLGCTMSSGDGVMGYMIEALKYMKEQNRSAFCEIFANVDMKSIIEAEDLFDKIVKEIRG